jgi:hypothetical protein
VLLQLAGGTPTRMGARRIEGIERVYRTYLFD